MRRIALFALCLLVAASATAFAQTRRAPTMKGVKPTAKAKPTVKKETSAEDALLNGPPPPPPPSKASQEEEIIVDTNLVTTPVTVLDRNGRFIPGLKQKDFKIFENGVAQRVTHFQAETTPFTVILMIDISPSTRYSIDDIRYAAVTFVNQLR